MYTYIYIGYSYDYYDIIYKSIEKNNKKVFHCMHPLANKNRIKKSFYYMLSEIRFKPISLMYNRTFFRSDLLDQLSNETHICFILHYGTVLQRGIELIKLLRKDWPNSKIVFHLTDTIDHCLAINPSFNIEEVKRNCDIVLSYNEKDAERYDLVIDRPKVIDYSEYYNDNEDKFDVLFIGQNKGRLAQIVDIFKLLSENGLVCQFYVIGVPKEEQILSSQIHYTDYIPYSKNLELVSNSKCVLNLIQSGAVGITLRDLEAIDMNKLLITNNTSIFSSPFYTKEKIIDVNNIDEELYKIHNNSSRPWNGKEEYSAVRYYQWLEELLTAL